MTARSTSTLLDVSATIIINCIVSPQDESNTAQAIGSFPNPISAQSLALLGST
jgi:hypothetical protein